MVTFSSARTPGNSLVMFFISSRKSLMSFSATAPPARAGGDGSEEPTAAQCAQRLLLLVDLLLLEVAGLDQHFVKVFLGDDMRGEQDGWDVLLVVVHHLAAGVDRLAGCDVDRHLDGLVP